MVGFSQVITSLRRPFIASTARRSQPLFHLRDSTIITITWWKEAAGIRTIVCVTFISISLDHAQVCAAILLNQQCWVFFFFFKQDSWPETLMLPSSLRYLCEDLCGKHRKEFNVIKTRSHCFLKPLTNRKKISTTRGNADYRFGEKKAEMKR